MAQSRLVTNRGEYRCISCKTNRRFVTIWQDLPRIKETQEEAPSFSELCGLDVFIQCTHCGSTWSISHTKSDTFLTVDHHA